MVLKHNLRIDQGEMLEMTGNLHFDKGAKRKNRKTRKRVLRH